MSNETEKSGPVTKEDLNRLKEQFKSLEKTINGKDLAPIIKELGDLRTVVEALPKDAVDLSSISNSIGNVQTKLGDIENRLGGSLTAAAFDDVKGKVNNIDTKVNGIDTNVNAIKNKKDWSPIIVAIIAGLFGLGSVLLQIHLQKKMEEALKDTEASLARSMKENEAYGSAVGTERANFYQQARTLLEKIDTSFAEVCYFPVAQPTPTNNPQKRERSKLTTSLDEYRTLLENAPDGLDDETKKQMKDYSEFVADSQFEILTKSLNDDEKKRKYDHSRALLKTAREAIKTSSKKPAFTSTEPVKKG